MDRTSCWDEHAFNQQGKIKMPIYEFVCEDCGHPFEELLLSAAALEKLKCPHCNSITIRKKISLFSSNAGIASTGTPASRACTTGT